jgi:hypothetical protein
VTFRDAGLALARAGFMLYNDGTGRLVAKQVPTFLRAEPRDRDQTLLHEAFVAWTTRHRAELDRWEAVEKAAIATLADFHRRGIGQVVRQARVRLIRQERVLAGGGRPRLPRDRADETQPLKCACGARHHADRSRASL